MERQRIVRLVVKDVLGRLKKRARELTGGARGVSLTRMVEDLWPYLQGWQGYFGHCQTPSMLRDLEQCTALGTLQPWRGLAPIKRRQRL